MSHVQGLEASVVSSLPKGTGKATVNRIVRGLAKEVSRLRHEFTNAVDKEVVKRVELRTKLRVDNLQAAQDKAEAQFERTIKMGAGVKAFMSKSEFNLIRSCLHPDKNPHPKAAEAFRIFNKLADVKKW